MGRDSDPRADWERQRFLRFNELVGEIRGDRSDTSDRRVWLGIVREALKKLEAELPTPMEFLYDRGGRVKEGSR